MKLTKKFMWVFLIIFQIVIGAGAGLLFFSVSEVEPQISNTKAGDVILDSISIEEGRQLLDEYYNDQVKNGYLLIEIDRIPFTIPYSDIDIIVDIDRTVDNLGASLPQNALEKYFYNSRKENNVLPYFTYNSGKLIRRCEELLSHYEIEPMAESYKIENGTLVVVHGCPGLDIDYKLLEQELRSRIFTYNEPLKVNTDNSTIFIKFFAEPVYKEDFTTIITKSDAEYVSSLEDKVKSSFESLDNVIIENGQELILSSLLDFTQFTNEVERDLLNRFATAIYQAALPMDGIKVLNRKPAQIPVSYTQPGLEAVIEGEGADLVLKNETGNSLLLLSEMTNDSFILYFVSTNPLKTGTLNVEEGDHVPPSVITMVNESLSPNVTRVVTDGIPGFTAHVTRTIDGVTQEISRDKYLPISKIVETGAKPDNRGSK